MAGLAFTNGPCSLPPSVCASTVPASELGQRSVTRMTGTVEWAGGSPKQSASHLQTAVCHCGPGWFSDEASPTPTPPWGSLRSRAAPCQAPRGHSIRHVHAEGCRRVSTPAPASSRLRGGLRTPSPGTVRTTPTLGTGRGVQRVPRGVGGKAASARSTVSSRSSAGA